MRIPRLLPLLALCLSAAWGQSPPATVERIFQFDPSDTPASIQNMVTVFRSAAGIRQVSVDAAARTVTLQASAGQVELAEWLLHALDGPGAAMQEYVVPGGGDDVVRVFRPAPAWNPVQLQEATNALRMLAEVQQAYSYTPSASLVMRGQAWQAKLSAWIVQVCGVATAGTAGDEYTIPSMRIGTVKVFRPASAAGPQQLQELVNSIRSITGVQRTIYLGGRSAVIARGEAWEIQFADWLVQHLDSPPPGQRSASYQVDRIDSVYPGGARLYYFPPDTTLATLFELVNRIRIQTEVDRAVVYSARNALALRGTNAQMTATDDMVASALSH